MEIRRICNHKKNFLPLLLLGDEQESMIDRYLDRGDLYALYDGGLRAVCVVTREGKGLCELKNLATDPAHRRQGYGRRLVSFVCGRYRYTCHTIQVGTGDSPATLPFYKKLGFVESHRVPGFFTDHYDHPIVEEGVILQDMVYLKKSL